MPGLLQPDPYQSDEHVRGGQFKEEGDPNARETFNIGTGKATGLLNCMVRNTATKINAEKLNCAEDCRICWTTYQNLSLWFDSWEVFLVDYGFATTNRLAGQLIIPENMKTQILNINKTCL
jgi:hypothetical protein